MCQQQNTRMNNRHMPAVFTSLEAIASDVHFVTTGLLPFTGGVQQDSDSNGIDKGKPRPGLCS
ncbi:hypothetical protein [Dictyobacter arantiisoli]|uniref:hypothetical protein n=1 Tax=Dictyobacter arantiisoli TaxID=2014874 RepID=UPI0011EBFE15|nr:hypothetical protein [Dictyobacter arantiisoli]